jgi:hypothetical protein
MDVLSDSSLFSNNGDITTKEILKRISDRSSGGARQYDTELVHRQDNSRPMATRVDTDPSAWQQERSVRPVQENAASYTTHQGTPPQTKWRGPEGAPSPQPNQFEAENVPPAPDNGQRREWRNSGWGRHNPSVTTTGT